LNRGRRVKFEKFIVRSSWAEFALRALPVLWLLTLLTLIVFASILVAVASLMFVAKNGADAGIVIMLPLEALLVRSVGHVGRLLASFTSIVSETRASRAVY